MSRQRKTSAAEDLMHIVAFFPWWIGVTLAIAAYFGLHAYATTQPAASSLTPSQMADAAASTILRTAATFAQYLLPCIFLVGSVVSAVRVHQRSALLHTVAAGKGTSTLNDITWLQFELVVGQWFRQQGYAVSERGGAGADGGIDLVVKKDNETYFVQCKQWRTIKVGVSVVRELYGVMAAHGAAGGFVITSGSFTADAQKFANGRNLQLLDGEYLARMIQTTNDPADTFPRPHTVPQLLVEKSIPHCPVCGVQMVQRVAKRGATVGQRFWGCSGYPKCRGTMPG